MGRSCEAIRAEGDHARSPISRTPGASVAGHVGFMAAIGKADASRVPIMGCIYTAAILAFRAARSVLAIILLLKAFSVPACALVALLEIGPKIRKLPVAAPELGADGGTCIFGRIRGHLQEGLDFGDAQRRLLPRREAVSC